MQTTKKETLKIKINKGKNISFEVGELQHHHHYQMIATTSKILVFKFIINIKSIILKKNSF